MMTATGSRIYGVDTASVRIRLARLADVDAILEMRDRAAAWLSKKHTDQWQQPWPSAQEQARRISWAINNKATWMLVDGERQVGTVTVFGEDLGGLWSEREDTGDPALYLQRLIVIRDYAGRGLGARVLDWAAESASRRGRKWLRIDVWANNLELHEYYIDNKFSAAGDVSKEVLRLPYLTDYPSTALFQRAVTPKRKRSLLRWREAVRLWDKMV